MIQKKIFWGLSLLIVMALPDSRVHAKNANTDGKTFMIGNKAIRLSFDGTHGVLKGFKNITTGLELLGTGNSLNSPWEITLSEHSAIRQIDIFKARSFTYFLPDKRTAVLEWSHFTDQSDASLKVKVEVEVDSVGAFSEWSISLTGTEGMKIINVSFPKLYNFNQEICQEFVVPQWMGELIENPLEELMKRRDRSFVLSYPGVMSMQFEALYNDKGAGIYLACNDTMNFAKQFSLYADSLRGMNFQVNNYPAFGLDLKEYSPAYKVIVGAFKGDWLSAAFIYRKWASGQRWARESRLRSKKDPSWIDSTALWVWNRGESSNVLTPAESLKARLKLPVSVLWHWWHGCKYDDGFPDYFPPREGAGPFHAAVSKASKEGINEVLYMNSFQWGTHNEDFRTRDASRWAVKNISGETEAHVFNIFTHHSLTPMCMATDFWQNFYDSLSEKAVKEYKVSGVYMDQACISFPCYDENHGHTQGGGNYWVNGFGLLTNKIRTDARSEKPVVLTGEGCSENWLPFLDGFLTLQVSQERYAGVQGGRVIPLFQSVYHQYGITFGNYSSLVSPPYDALWPKADAPENPESLLSPEFNRQFLMEQARSFVWGMQPTIANYHEFLANERSKEVSYLMDLAGVRYRALKFLLYGKFVRAPFMDVPQETIPISRLSIYAGQNERVNTLAENVPLIYYSAWQAGDGQVGIPIASISDKPYRVRLAFKTTDYQLSSKGKIYIVNRQGRRHLTNYADARVNIDFELPASGICFLEIVPNEKAQNN